MQGGEAVRLCAGQWDVNGNDLHNFWITSSKKEPLVLSFLLPLPTGEHVGMGAPASTVSMKGTPSETVGQRNLGHVKSAFNAQV